MSIPRAPRPSRPQEENFGGQLQEQVRKAPWLTLSLNFTYNHAIASFALAKAYELTRSQRLKKPVERAVAFIESCRNPGGARLDMYAWYYGTLALYQVGGPRWERWNRAMQEAIVAHQATDGVARGSWDPIGAWGEEGGRVHATALLTMCLEVYYRYPRVFGGERR